MSKIVRLTESDLVRIVKRVISEQDITPPSIKGKKLSNSYGTIIQKVEPNRNKGQFNIFDEQGLKDGHFRTFICKNHERGGYSLHPNWTGKNIITSQDSQMLYDAFCKPTLDSQNI